MSHVVCCPVAVEVPGLDRPRVGSAESHVNDDGTGTLIIRIPFVSDEDRVAILKTGRITSPVARRG